MSLRTTGFRQLARPFRPFQDPNLKPWTPEAYSRRPHLAIRILGVFAFIGAVAFGINQPNQAATSADLTLQSQSTEAIEANLIDDLLDLLDEIYGGNSDDDQEQDEEGPKASA